MRTFFLALLIAALPIVTQAQNVALVIGNSNYQTVATLANPVNDARSVSEALRMQGFTVFDASDMGRAEMLSILRAFRGQADQSDIALVYYAGHGIEIAGRNYLIPVDARIADERDAPLEMIELQDVMSQLSGAGRMKMIVLDACRDNPFVTRIKRENKGRNIGRGLAIVNDAGADTLIAYAAAAGEVTPDGVEGGNSPFTRAFLNALAGPPADIRLLLGAVRDELRHSVPGSAPFVYSSLGGSQYIVNPNSAPAPAANVSPVPVLDENTLLIDFATAEISDTVEGWNGFLNKYQGQSQHTLYVLARRNRDILATAPTATAKQSDARSGSPAEIRDPTAALAAQQAPMPMVSHPSSAPKPSRNEAILEIQKLLKSRNCYSGRLDGLYGRQTAAGLRTLSGKADVPLSVDKSSSVDDLLQVIARLEIIDDVKCPVVAAVRKPSTAPRKKTQPAVQSPKTAAPSPAPKNSQPGQTIFRNPPNYCPQFGSSPGCRDGSPISN